MKQDQLLIAIVIMGGQTPKKKSLYQEAANYITAEGFEAVFQVQASIAVLVVFLWFGLLSIHLSFLSHLSLLAQVQVTFLVYGPISGFTC